MIGQFKAEIEAIIDNIIYVIYFMRGSVSYEECLQRTYGERQRLENFVNSRIEQQKDAPFPVL